MQKKILALHDLAGLGRSSLVPIIAVLSAMGHQCVPLPTAVYSSHHGLPGWQGCGLTDRMRPALGQYTSLGLRFDAVYSGFLSSGEQIAIVAEAAARLNAGLLIVDPVLGDNGRLYSSMTPALCAEMVSLCRRADVITPNSTEAAVLLGRRPDVSPEDDSEALEWVSQLHRRFGAAVVLTGLALHEGQLSIACCENGNASLLYHPRIGAYYPGTGDLFAAVLPGCMASGETAAEAARRAAGFVRECIAAAVQEGGDPLLGVPFEGKLRQLWEPPDV